MSNSKELYNETFPSGKTKRKRIIDSVIKKIQEINAPIEIKDHELYLVIDEAISNAMEHGNLWDPRKNINIRIIKNNGDLTLSIEDEGSGFNPAQLPGGTENLKLRGRGIFIMKHFCKLRWNKKGNRIYIQIPFQQ